MPYEKCCIKVRYSKQKFNIYILMLHTLQDKHGLHYNPKNPFSMHFSQYHKILI